MDLLDKGTNIRPSRKIQSKVYTDQSMNIPSWNNRAAYLEYLTYAKRLLSGAHEFTLMVP